MSASDAYVTIVSGLPRSGTSMMMRMLEAGGMGVMIDNLRRADDDNPAGYYEFEPVKQTRRDPSWVPGALGKATKMVYRLLYDLPPDYQYRVLFMRRDLEEVLASQKKMLARNARADEVDDAQMARLYRSELARFDQWIADKANFTRLDINYNELLSDAAPVARRAADFLDGRVDPDAMCAVVDPSLYRNRK